MLFLLAKCEFMSGIYFQQQQITEENTISLESIKIMWSSVAHW